jgi:putative ABC transport system permease protein
VSAAGTARRLATGEAGPGIAWILAAAALLTAFLATAAPREITATGAAALNAAVASLNSADTAITVTGQWQAIGGQTAHLITAADVTDVAGEAARLMRPPVSAPAARRWGGISTGLAVVTNPARSAVLALPPDMEVAYRSDLAAHARLISGTLPDQATVSSIGPAGQRTILQVAVTSAVAAPFRLRPGSVLRLGPSLWLQVTGVLAATDPAGSFWTIDPLLGTAEIQRALTPTAHYAAGALIGPGELTALQEAVPGQGLQGYWFLPLDLRGVSPAILPGLLAGVANVTSSVLPTGLGPVGPGGRPQFSFLAPPTLGCGLAGALSDFLAEQPSAAAIGSLIVVGLLVASLILLLICARLAADAYRPELTLLRVRGGSIGQAAARVLGRAGLIAGPSAAAGAGLAVLAVPASGTPLPWLPGLAVGIIAVGAPVGFAAWRQRRARLPGGGERDELSTLRPSRRRTVAEVTVMILAAGALGTLYLQGGQGRDGAYTSASPVLAALAASLLAARIYPFPVRGLLRAAATRPGPVGFLGLASAARARSAAVAPALALVLTMTMAAFAAMVAGSVSAAQSVASWQSVGADATLQAKGNNVISASAQHTLGALPGVTSEAAVYTATSSGPFAAQLDVGTRAAQTVGLAVVDPSRYAALSDNTPWPGFPARLLARGLAGDRVPVLASGPVAAAMTADPHRTGVLELDGQRITVSIEAAIGRTPAFPAGGSFVVLPQWATARLPSIAGPNVLLATGTAVGTRQFSRTAAATVPGGLLTLRQQVLRALYDAPAPLAAERMATLGIWAAAALTAAALLIGLAAPARDRARLVRRMSALGMATRQARALALTETVPLLAVGVLGMLAAAVGLALLIGPGLNLAVFVASTGFVPVRPLPAALLLPAAGSVVVALAIVAVQSALIRQRGTAATAPLEEAG